MELSSEGCGLTLGVKGLEEGGREREIYDGGRSKLAGVREDAAGDWLRPLANSEASGAARKKEEKSSYHLLGATVLAAV